MYLSIYLPIYLYAYNIQFNYSFNIPITDSCCWAPRLSCSLSDSTPRLWRDRAVLPATFPIGLTEDLIFVWEYWNCSFFAGKLPIEEISEKKKELLQPFRKEWGSVGDSLSELSLVSRVFVFCSPRVVYAFQLLHWWCWICRHEE